MASKKYWNRKVSQFGSLMKQVKVIESVEIQGVEFKVLPNVFSPVYSSDTRWFAEYVVPLVKKKKFLEIGAGAGVIACLASKSGALKVVATDINPEAVKNTELNADLLSLKISVREGSIFDPIKRGELFDVIFWNHPFNYIDKKEFKDHVIDRSLFDLEYQSLKEFVKKGKNHLAKNGQLLLGSSDTARVRLIKKIAKDEGFEISLLAKKQVPLHKGRKIKMELRMYLFTRNQKKQT